jgi:hypothetical protein
MKARSAISGWITENVVHRLVLPLGEPEVYTEDEADLAKRLEVSDEKLSTSLLAESKEIAGGMQDTAQSIESRAMTLQSAVAIATTLTLTAGGLLLDRTKIASGNWRVGFAIVLFLSVVAFIASGLRALGASSRTHPWAQPGYNDIFDHAKLDLGKAQAAYAAAHLKSAGMNLRIVQIKGGYLNAAVWWFRIALAGLLVFAAMFAAYTVDTKNGSASAAPATAPRILVHSAPSGFGVEPDISDPLCNGGRGVRLRAGLRGDAVVASATMPDGSTWVAFSEIYPGKRFAVLRSVTRECSPNSEFGHDGAATIKISSRLRPGHPAAPGSPTDGLWVNVVARRNGGGAIVAGTYGGEWVVGEVTRSGGVDPTFGDRGWTVLPFRGAVTAVVQERSGRIVIGGDNGGGGCCTLNWAAALSARGEFDHGFGTHGRAELPTGEDSRVGSLALEPNGDILAKVDYGNMGCWGTALAMLMPTGRPVPLFGQRLDRFWHGLGFGAFVGDVYIDGDGFTVVGTGQRPCAEGPSFSARSATGLIARFRTDGESASDTIRFPSRMYGSIEAFHEGNDAFVVESPYADATRQTITARHTDGSIDPRFGSDGHASIRTPWRGFNATLDTEVSITQAGPRAIVVVATRSGRLQIIRVRL